jgi:hypothetical protein
MCDAHSTKPSHELYRKMRDAHPTAGEQKGDGDLELMLIVLDRPDSVP